MHDEPQILATAMAPDPICIRFLETACSHAYPRAQAIMRTMLASIDGGIEAQINIVALVNVIAQRLEARRALSAPG